MLTKYEEDRINDAIAIISEHFPNFALAVLNENDQLHADYSSFRIGRMLFRDALEDMEIEMRMVNDMESWEECELDEEDWDDE